jgi:hypothetical protein
MTITLRICFLQEQPDLWVSCHTDGLSPALDPFVRSTVCTNLALSLSLILRQHGLVEMAETLDHTDDIAIFGIELPDLLFVLLVPTQADLMASRQLMLVSFDVVGDLLRGVLVHEANGTLDTRSGVRAGLRSRFLKHSCTDGVRGWMWDMIFTTRPWLHIQRLLGGL